MVISQLRPLLRIVGGTFFSPPAAWQNLDTYRSQINEVAAAVGTVHSSVGSSTGFMIGRDVMLTSHSGALPIRVNFGESAGTFEECPFEAVEILAKFKRPNTPLECALLKVRPRSSATLPPSLPVAEEVSLKSQDYVYLVSYPQFRDISNETLREVVGDTEQNAKRLQPGRVLVPPKDDKVVYDISTFYRSAGAPLVALTTGQVFGIHYGTAGADKGKMGIMLGDLMGRARAIELGVTFASVLTRP